MGMMTRGLLLFCVVLFIGAICSGCGQHRNLLRSAASVPLAEMIEPVKDSQQTAQKKPLKLPASVAIMFVPAKLSYVPLTTLRQAAEQLKQQLLANPQYISSVALVSNDDMRSKMPLRAVQQVYAVDVAIILSYQQDQRNSQGGVAGFLDLTIVGNYIIPGVRTDTASFVDGKVVHIPSDALIFRASGADTRSAHSTSHSEQNVAIEESLASLLAATADFGKSLSQTLKKFDNYDLSQAVLMSALTTSPAGNSPTGKPANDYWRSVDTYKSSGGGAFGLLSLLISSALCYAIWRHS